MKLDTARILYDACPLCTGNRLETVGETDCSDHPLHAQELGSSIPWRACTDCGHVFAAGWLEEDAHERLRERAAVLDANLDAELGTAGHDLEASRRSAARIVTTVTSIRGGPGGRWLDVGLGDGGLLTTADEFGYDAVGIGPRRQVVATLREHGYEAHYGELAQFDQPRMFDVISFADVLHRTPHPRAALEHAHRILREEGLIFVSTPNMDCYPWKLLDQRGRNPHWSDLENLHHFGRDRLYQLLRRSGFEPCHYAIGEDGPAHMEVVGVKPPEQSSALKRADEFLERLRPGPTAA